MPAKVVFVRHGESEWNLKNLFCGWYDADLSDAGVAEAKAGGAALKNSGYTEFDLVFTSVLTRAIKTSEMMLDGAYEGNDGAKNNVQRIPTWRLNERHYGGLTGLDKIATVEKYGQDQVQIWRRSFDTPPPDMNSDHEFFNAIRNDPRYKPDFDNGSLTDETFPKAESLELTIKRTLPFWNDQIVPALKAGKKVLVAAHGNSLRGIVCHLDKISKDDIMELNLPTGIPFVYELDNFQEDGSCDVLKSMQFLGDDATVAAAIEKVKAQSKKK